MKKLSFVLGILGFIGMLGWAIFGIHSVKAGHSLEESSVIVFEHVNLIDGISNVPLKNMTVVIENGKITDVTDAIISLPIKAKRFNLSGLWLLPGYIDAHIHPTSIEDAKRMLASTGMTTGRSMFTVHYIDVEIRDRHRHGEFDLPDILSAGYPAVPNFRRYPINNIESIFIEYPKLSYLRGSTDIGVAGVKQIVDANLDRKVDVIKVYATNSCCDPSIDPRGRTLSNEQLVAAVGEANKSGIPVAAHAYGDEAVVAVVQAGVYSVEHGVYLSDKTLKIMKDKNVFFVPTISVYKLQVPTMFNVPDASDARRHDLAVNIRDAARRAYKMGLRIIAGADGAACIGDEIEELVKIGMTPMEAIKSATSKSADALGISKRTGSVQRGMEADLIVLNSNPLDDIKALGKIVMVVNDGKIVSNHLPQTRTK